MQRFITCFLIITLMPVIAARADNVSEQRDIVSKKAAFLHGQKDYIKQKAASVNGIWERFSEAVSDYLRMYDEMTDDQEASDLSEGQLSKLMQQISHLNRLIPMQLPGFTEGQTGFGAYYTKLDYYPEWDKPWRVGPDADVIVRFGKDSPRFIFWRGASYIPHWVADNGLWYTNQFNETWPPNSCCEPMGDKQCRYSHVRIIESHPARVVVHWRYALCDVDYKIAWPNEQTGWGDWTDEYYTLYPDAIGTRRITLHTSHTDDYEELETDDHGHEWAEGIAVFNAFVFPEEMLNYDAIHVANMAGATGRWIWNEPGQPETHTPDGANIFMINSRSLYKPFVISPPGSNFDVYTGCSNGSRFNWWDHWPVTLDATSGRRATGRNAAHGSFFHIIDMPVYAYGPDRITKVHLHGMTQQDVDDLVPIAKSWDQAPKLDLAGSGFTDSGYDKTQRAYVLTRTGKDKVNPLSIELAASEESPLFNPAFVITNWGEGDIELKLNGKALECGEDYRVGHRHQLESTDLIVWVRYESEKPTEIEIEPAD